MHIVFVDSRDPIVTEAGVVAVNVLIMTETIALAVEFIEPFLSADPEFTLAVFKQRPDDSTTDS